MGCPWCHATTKAFSCGLQQLVRGGARLLTVDPFNNASAAYSAAPRQRGWAPCGAHTSCYWHDMRRSTRSAVAAVAERQLQTPHGGELVDLMAPAGEHAALKAACTKSIELSDRNACDVELLTVGCGVTGTGHIPGRFTPGRT